MKKKSLNYSALTDNIYWVDGKGEKHDITQDFIQMVLLWINKDGLPDVGNSMKRVLKHDNKVKFEIVCKRTSE